MILRLAVLDAVQQLRRIGKPAGHGDLHLGAGEVVLGLLDVLDAADLTEFGALQLLAGHDLGNGTQGRLHHAAGRTEDMSRTGGHAEDGVELLIGQLGQHHTGTVQHIAQLTGGDGNIHIGQAHGALAVPADLILLRGAGHHAYHHDILGVEALLLGVVGLYQCTEHLLRALAGGKVLHKFGVIMLAEFDPAGGTAGDEGQGAALLQAVQQLGALLHDGHIGGGVHVKYPVEAQPAQGSYHLALHVGADGHPEAFAQLGAHAGGRPHDHRLGRVVQRSPYLIGVVTLPQGGGGTYGGALAAGNAGGLGKGHIKGAGDVRIKAALAGFNNACILGLLADGHAAAAQDALTVIPDQMGHGAIGVVALILSAEAVHIHAVFPAQLLQLAVGAAGAGKAVGTVGGKDQFQRGTAVFLQGGGIGEYLHALIYRHNAGSGQAAGALYLAYADAAGADGIDLLEVAQGGDADAGQMCGLQYGGAFGSDHGDVIDLEIYGIHARSLLSYRFTMAPKRQVSMQAPHLMHFLASMAWGFLTSPEIALTGQARAQAVQPLHLFSSITNLVSRLQTPAGQRLSMQWASYSSRK